MGRYFFGKQTSINFVIQNNLNRKINVFNIPIWPGQQVDLLSYAEVTETGIRDSLITGELANRIRQNEISIISTSIDLTQFDQEQKQFLMNAGASIGIDPAQAAKDAGSPFIQLSPLEDEPPPNSYFFDVDGTPSYTDEDGDPHAISSGGAVDFSAVNAALNEADNTIQFNYQLLNRAGHPDPFTAHGVATAGWSKAKYLRASNNTVIADDTVDSGTQISLERAFFQSVVFLNKNNWVEINFPPDAYAQDGDIINLYVESHATCVLVNFGNDGDQTFSGKSITSFVYEGGWNNQTVITEEQWISAVVGNAVGQGGIGILFLPDGGNISGLIYGDIIALNDLTLTGDVGIYGNVYCSNDINNGDGYVFNVYGDVNCDTLNFNPNDPDTLDTQNDATITGTLLCQDINFQVAINNSPTLSIGEDLIVYDTICAVGANGAGGLNINVNNNAVCSFINVSGGDADSVNDLNAGNGGEVSAYGSFYCDTIYSMGGDNSDSENLSGGHGGNLVVQGNLLSSVFLDGGDSAFDDAGNAGTLTVGGDVYLGSFSAIGGLCSSDNEEMSSGEGGEVTIYGSLTMAGSNYFNISGGDRQGTLSTSNSSFPAFGGTATISGNFISNTTDVIGNGGSIDTVNFPSGDAATGATFTIGGDFFYQSFNANGGTNVFANGGAGGSLTVTGDIICSNGTTPLVLNGGNGNTNNDSDFNGNGGDGGTLTVGGDCIAGIQVEGGSGYNASGGNGGSITVNGHVKALTNILATGGNTTTINNDGANAGVGGVIVVKNGLYCDGDIYVSAGGIDGSNSETGNTTVLNAGSINVQSGDLIADDVFAIGGSSSTNFPCCNAGNGGEISVGKGNVIITNHMILDGGSSNGRNGGVGGSLICSGRTVIGSLLSSDGGDSNVAPGDSSQGQKGYGGQITFTDGCLINTISIVDGTDGTDNSSGGTIFVSGNCNFVDIEMTDNSNYQIKTSNANDFVAMLIVRVMGVKNTLDNSDGSTTANLTSLLNTSIFKFSTGVWYVLTGTPA